MNSRATVTRLDDDGRPYVEVRRRSAGYEYGPLQTLVAGLAEGDHVVVGAIDDNREDLVVLGLVQII